MARGHTGFRRATRQLNKAGFSLLEVLIAMGVIAVLISLLLPATHRSISKAKSLTALQVISQNSALILAYQNDYREVFPISNRAIRPIFVGTDYFYALKQAGLISSIHDVDPWFADRKEASTIMAPVLAMDWNLTIPGNTIPVNDVSIFPVRLSDVAYPSNKGQIVREYAQGERGDEGWWCCYDNAPRTQVSFCDGSVGEYKWQELLPNGTYYKENGIGGPVLTTWYGCKGIDRGKR